MHVGRAAFHGDTHIHSLNVLLSILVSDILPVFLIAGAGFLLARKLQASVKTMSHVSFYALSPCLAFKMLATSKMTGSEAVRMVLQIRPDFWMVIEVVVKAGMGREKPRVVHEPRIMGELLCDLGMLVELAVIETANRTGECGSADRADKGYRRESCE